MTLPTEVAPADEPTTKRRFQKSKLVVVRGVDKGKELLIERERVTIGRGVICDMVLTDPLVSGSHCEIVANEKGFLLRDLDSTGGTFIGEFGVREVWLSPGAVVGIGDTEFEFRPTSGTVEIDISGQQRFYELVGRSVRMREVFAVLEKAAASDLIVLIRGETGTGKELVARAIHRASRRAKKPLVVQDCSAIPKHLIESTLFGHEKGSFTGAIERHAGCFEQADGGTIFLDEIGELHLSQQPNLLRVLEARQVQRVGGTKSIPVDVRVVAATNRDLRQMVNEGTFREDLYYRLSVVQVDLPPLRERPQDIPVLVRTFLDEFCQRRFPGEDRRYTVTSQAMERLLSYRWPGNVRELKNTIERAVSLSDDLELGVRDLLPSSQKTPPAVLPGGAAERYVHREVPFKEAKQRVIDAFESGYLKALLEKHDGNISRSANEAGLTRYHLRELAKRYGLRGDS